MRPGTVVAGIIVFLLGLVGLLELYGRPLLPFSLAIVSAYLTPLGTFVLFGAITVIGLGLIVGGLVTQEKVTVEREVVVTQPVSAPAVYATLSELELTILRYLSQRKDESEIAKETGVAKPTISEKIAKLHAEGYITDKQTLTEKGFEALRTAETRRT